MLFFRHIRIFEARNDIIMEYHIILLFNIRQLRIPDALSSLLNQYQSP